MAARRKKKNVVSLFGTAPPVPQVNDDVIERLNYLLRLAKDGQICGLAYAAIEPSGTHQRGWCGNAEIGRMISAVALLNHRLLSRHLEMDDAETNASA